MPQKAKNYGARYSVPVSHEGAALVAAEMTHHQGRPLGETLGNILVEGIRSRMTARGLDPSQFGAVRPGEAAACPGGPFDPAAADGDDRGKLQQGHPSGYPDSVMPQEGAEPILPSEPMPTEAA